MLFVFHCNHLYLSIKTLPTGVNIPPCPFELAKSQDAFQQLQLQVYFNTEESQLAKFALSCDIWAH